MKRVENIYKSQFGKKCSKFTGEHLWQNAISIKFLCNFTKTALRHECSFPCKFAAYFQNTLSKEHQWWTTSNAIILLNENGNEWKATCSEHNSIKVVEGFLQQKNWKKTYLE